MYINVRGYNFEFALYCNFNLIHTHIYITTHTSIRVISRQEPKNQERKRVHFSLYSFL